MNLLKEYKMQGFEELISKVKSDIENYMRQAYNLGAESVEEDDHPILPPLEPSIIPPPFPVDPFKIIEWEGDTECCSLQTLEAFKQFNNNFLYAGTAYVYREVICPIIHKHHGLYTVFYDLSHGHILNIGETDGHNGAHLFATVDKEYFGWPTKWLPVPEYEFINMCYLCFGERFECRVGAKEKATLELVAHKPLHYVKVEAVGHSFANRGHLHLRSDVGGQRIEKGEVDLLMYEL